MLANTACHNNGSSILLRVRFVTCLLLSVDHDLKNEGQPLWCPLAGVLTCFFTLPIKHVDGALYFQVFSTFNFRLCSYTRTPRSLPSTAIHATCIGVSYLRPNLPRPSVRPSPALSSCLLCTFRQLSFSLLSAVGSIFIIVTYWKFPRLHTFAYRVIMMLAVANLCLDCAYLVGNVGHDK